MSRFLIKSPQLLIVDDEADSLAQMVSWLAPRQTRVYQARSGEQALHVLSKKTINAVVSDWQLPGLSGLELVRALRSSGFSGPLLICTGYMLDAEHLQLALTAGANDYLRKPMHVVEFNARLDNALHLHAQQAALRHFSESQHQLMQLMTEQLGGDLQRLLQLQQLTRAEFQPSHLPVPPWASEQQELAEQLAQRFQKLMNWSRYRFALGESEPERCEVKPLLKFCLQALGEPGQRVQLSVPVGQQVLADPALLQRVLGQLLDNALRYTTGPLRLKVTLNELRVRFSLQDEGALSEGELERLLAGQGLGLGLRICHDLLALMGSRLQGAPRRGSSGVSFYFELPAS